MRKLIFGVLLMVSSAAYAVPVEWTIENGMAGAQTYGGSFIFDADAVINPYTDVTLAYLQDPIVVAVPDASNLEVDGFNGSAMTHYIAFDTPLTNAGGIVTFTGFIYSEDACGFNGGFCADLSGQVVANVVPVPAAAWLFGSALAGLGWLRRKQNI